MNNIELTDEERKVVTIAVKNSIDLRNRYMKLFTEDKKMKRKQNHFKEFELPNLRSAFKKLKG